MSAETTTGSTGMPAPAGEPAGEPASAPTRAQDRGEETSTTSAEGDVVDLPRDLVPSAIALWDESGLTRPWNDPEADCLRALDGAESTVLCLRPRAGGPREVELLGTVMVGHDGHRGWIYYLAVPAGLRGQGIGERLVRAAESWLQERGVLKLMLMVRRENAAVRAFYDRLGYSEQDVVTLGRFL